MTKSSKPSENGSEDCCRHFHVQLHHFLRTKLRPRIYWKKLKLHIINL